MRPDRKVRFQWERGWNAGGRWVFHRRIVGSLLLLLVLPLVPEAWGAVRYVSKSGVNNPDCTQAAPCSSIQHAVNVAVSGDTISIGKGKFQECVIIEEDLTLNGTGIFSTRVVGYVACSSIFKVKSGVTVTITDLDVMFGQAELGGGILNHGHLTLDWIRVWKNSAKVGGGIYNTGSLTINNSEIAHNSASEGGGGLHNQGVAELHEVRIVKNYADAGSGGIYNTGGGGPATSPSAWS